MYLSHFGLEKLPFGITPDPSFFFSGNSRGEILDALLYTVNQGDGIVKVTGEVGSGKTMLCRMLESKLPAHVEVIFLAFPSLTWEQVIYTIAGELDLPTKDLRVDQVIRKLQVTLIEKHIQGKQVVLLVEEAQAMSLQTLEQIRLISNLETAHHKLLQIILFGQPELDTHLNLSGMRQLKERITTSFNVPPLTDTNVGEYLRFRLHAAGYRGPPLFDKPAIKLMAAVSGGIVRRISILADKSLLAAFADNADTVSAKHVSAAISDSEFPGHGLKRMRLQFAAPALTVLLMLAVGVAWHAGKFQPKGQAMPAATALKSTLATSTSLAKIATIAPPIKVAPAPASLPVAAQTIAPPAKNAHPDIQAPLIRNENPIEPRAEFSNTWITQQPVDHYSIQLALIVSSDRNAADITLRKLKSEIDPQDIHLYAYRSSAPESPYFHFGILYGSFANKTEAIKTLNQLSEQWGYKAQLRTFSGINKEIGMI